MLRRLYRNLFFPVLRLRRAFPASTLASIEQAVKSGERNHFGEIRFAVESALDPTALWRCRTGRERAIEVFAELHVWDTELNSGVLIYVLLADRDVEIVADRGIASRVSHEEWQGICHHVEREYRAGNYEEGSLAAVAAVSEILARHFPANGDKVNELPDKPYVR